MQPLASWQFGVGGLDAAADLRGDLSDYASGSRNLVPFGRKQSRPFKGLTSAGTGSGGRQMVQLKNSWGSLDDDGATPGRGTLFSSIADMLVYIGQGQVKVEGTAVAGATASNLLRFLLKWNGSYTDSLSGPYTAGLPEPSAPQVGVISGDLYGAPNLTGTVSVKEARLRVTTGDRSRASETSDVLPVTGKSIWAKVSPAVSGQTHHIFFGTRTILGGIGLHYRIARANPFTNAEYTVADVERDVTITSVTDGDKLNAASGTFTAGDIGKLVEGVSGLTIADGVTVAEVVSSSQIRLSTTVTGTSGTVTLVAYAGGIRRTVVLNWKASDLVEETAWIYDFPPPTGSHAFQMGSRMWVAAYADAAARAAATPGSPDASASASSTGTALCPSQPNQFGSFDPRFPVYIPEAVVDILTDGMESYQFLGGRNGLYAIMDINATDAPPATLQILIKGEGIKHKKNWCARERAIYAITATGVFTRIIEGGQVDKSFANPIKHLIRDWDQDGTTVTGHPMGDAVLFMNGTKAVWWDEKTERWSTEIGLNDYATGTVVSAVATQSRSLITLETGGVRTAYYVDENASSGYIVGIGQYQDDPAPQYPKAVQRLAVAAVADRTDRAGYIGLHVNTLRTHITDAAMTASSNVLTSSDLEWTDELEGSYILVRGAGAAGGFLFGRLKRVSGQTRVFTPVADLSAAVALNASATVSGKYALIAFRIFPFVANRKGTFELDSGEMYLPGITSYAPSLVIETNGTTAQPLSVGIEGMVTAEQGWGTPSAGFNQTP